MGNEIDKAFEEEWKKRCKPAEYCGGGVSIIDKEEARNLFHCAAWLQIAKTNLAKPEALLPLLGDDRIKAASVLCQTYFEIAAEVLGDDEVRRRRDEKLAAIK